MKGKYDYLAHGDIKRAKHLTETGHLVPWLHQLSLLCVLWVGPPTKHAIRSAWLHKIALFFITITVNQALLAENRHRKQTVMYNSPFLFADCKALSSTRVTAGVYRRNKQALQTTRHLLAAAEWVSAAGQPCPSKCVGADYRGVSQCFPWQVTHSFS